MRKAQIELHAFWPARVVRLCSDIVKRHQPFTLGQRTSLSLSTMGSEGAQSWPNRLASMKVKQSARWPWGVDVSLQNSTTGTLRTLLRRSTGGRDGLPFLMAACVAGNLSGESLAEFVGGLAEFLGLLAECSKIPDVGVITERLGHASTISRGSTLVGRFHLDTTQPRAAIVVIRCAGQSADSHAPRG